MVAWLLAVGLAAAAPCDTAGALATLRGGGGDARAAYDCLAGEDRAGALLVAAIDAAAPVVAPAAAPAEKEPVTPDAVGEVAATLTGGDALARARLTRALAVWFLARPDVAWDPLQVARLAAADRRLVADGIHARRGRKSPVREHEGVFEQLGWYKPRATYSDNLLTEVDHLNLQSVDHPPAIPPPPPPDAVADDDGPAKPPGGGPPPPGEKPASGGCGCATPPGSAGAGAWGLLAAWGAARRARRSRRSEIRG